MLVTTSVGCHFITEGFLLPPICQLARRRFSRKRDNPDILSLAARRVNPARPSPAGPLPPAPSVAPAWASLTPADRARLDAAADADPGGDVESDPEDWPAWTNFHVFEPTPEDRAAWAAESERIESAREDRRVDLLAAESAALDAMERGLIPADPSAE